MAGFNGRSRRPRRLSAGSASGNDLGVLLISSHSGIATARPLTMTSGCSLLKISGQLDGKVGNVQTAQIGRYQPKRQLIGYRLVASIPSIASDSTLLAIT